MSDNVISLSKRRRDKARINASPIALSPEELAAEAAMRRRPRSIKGRGVDCTWFGQRDNSGARSQTALRGKSLGDCSRSCSGHHGTRLADLASVSAVTLAALRAHFIHLVSSPRT